MSVVASSWCQLHNVASMCACVVKSNSSSNCRDRHKCSACLPFGCTTHVQVQCANECAVAPVSEGCHHQAAAVAEVLIPVLSLR
jgi:hypothetical protein